MGVTPFSQHRWQPALPHVCGLSMTWMGSLPGSEEAGWIPCLPFSPGLSAKGLSQRRVQTASLPAGFGPGARHCRNPWGSVLQVTPASPSPVGGSLSASPASLPAWHPSQPHPLTASVTPCHFRCRLPSAFRPSRPGCHGTGSSLTGRTGCKSHRLCCGLTRLWCGKGQWLSWKVSNRHACCPGNL